jgi:hypothetical protein
MTEHEPRRDEGRDAGRSVSSVLGRVVGLVRDRLPSWLVGGGAEETVTRSGSERPRPAGISNRPLDEERRAQEHLPPRRTAQGETEEALRPRPEEHRAPRDPAPKQTDPKSPRPDA